VVNPHPALKVAVPMNPMVDGWKGDDWFHNGAFRQQNMQYIYTQEATRASEVADKAAAFTGVAYRFRIMGSLALSLCHLAAGRVDGVCSLKPYRSVDVAAAQLLVREQGLSIANVDGDDDFADAPLDLVPRSRLAAAGTDELCRLVANGLR